MGENVGLPSLPSELNVPSFIAQEPKIMNQLIAQEVKVPDDQLHF